MVSINDGSLVSSTLSSSIALSMSKLLLLSLINHFRLSLAPCMLSEKSPHILIQLTNQSLMSTTYIIWDLGLYSVDIILVRLGQIDLYVLLTFGNEEKSRRFRS